MRIVSQLQLVALNAIRHQQSAFLEDVRLKSIEITSGKELADAVCRWLCERDGMSDDYGRKWRQPDGSN